LANYKRVFEEGYSYFITIVTQGRNPILIDNIDLLRQSFKHAKSKFDFDIDAIVILPEHLHTIITPSNANEYPKIISTLKRHFSKHCPQEAYAHIHQSNAREASGYIPVWQKRFYEHTIRNEKDFRLHLEYIHYNPIKHGLVNQAKDWEYSSFDKYVKMGWYDEDWGDFDNNIDLE